MSEYEQTKQSRTQPAPATAGTAGAGVFGVFLSLDQGAHDPRRSPQLGRPVTIARCLFFCSLLAACKQLERDAYALVARRAAPIIDELRPMVRAGIDASSTDYMTISQSCLRAVGPVTQLAGANFEFSLIEEPLKQPLPPLIAFRLIRDIPVICRNLKPDILLPRCSEICRWRWSDLEQAFESIRMRARIRCRVSVLERRA